MVALTIQLVGADKLQKGLSAGIKHLPLEQRAAMDQALLWIEGDARRKVKQDTRRLMNSINSRIDGSGDTLIGRVGPSVAYGVVVERGRRPNKPPPPIAALRGWASRHGIPHEALFVIARAIGRRGIPAAPYMVPAYDKNKARIEARFKTVCLKIVQVVTG